MRSKRRRLDSSLRFQYLHGREISRLSSAEKEEYAERAFRFWRRAGFPYPRMTAREIQQAYLSFSRSNAPVFLRDRHIQWSPLGIGLANYFQPHMWFTKCERFRTSQEVFGSPVMLRECIRRAMELWTDRRPVSPNNLRRIISTFTNTKRVSNFRPSVARALYVRYSRDGDLIVDPAAGYGGRLLGCLPLRRRYLGIEPNPRSMAGMRSMVARLRKLAPVTASVQLIKGCAEDILPRIKRQTAAVVICSPPYFARERYSTEATQSYLRYPSYGAWLTGFLDRLLKEAHRILRPGGYLTLNVANTESHSVEDDARSIAARYFRLHYTYRLRIGCVPYHRNGNRGGHRSEPLLVYQKRD